MRNAADRDETGPIRIAPFAPGLEQAVAEIIVPIQRAEFGIDITYDEQPDLKEMPDFYQSGAGDFWLAFDGDQAVGTIALRDIGAGDAALRKMFVVDSHRGGEPGVAHL